MSSIATVKAVSSNIPYLISLSDDLGHTWQADEPFEVGGGNVGPSPDRLLLASLGTCTAITLQMVAARRQWPLAGIQVELQLNPDGKPASGSDIVRRITVQGDLSAEQQAQLLKIANSCPIHKLLTGEIRIQTDLHR
jgi:putative redox protein